MRQDVRLGLILQQLNEHGSVGVTALAEVFDVSEASVRRDLQLLEKQKLLTRTHGGAVASGVLAAKWLLWLASWTPTTSSCASRMFAITPTRRWAHGSWPALLSSRLTLATL